MDDSKKYLRPEEASKLLKVTVRCLEMWEVKGKIRCVRTKGGHRRFLREDILSQIPEETRPKDSRTKICYCRVSTPSQREDLERQAEFFRLKYPDYRIIKDIGSGLNFKRKGLNTILQIALKGDLETLVVTHRDRLCRFGFELFESIIRNQNGEILVLDREKTSPTKELVDDLLSIITVFSSRLNGLRSQALKKQIKLQATKDLEDKTVPEQGRTESTQDNV